MSHYQEDEIICPHCDEQYTSDSWDYHDSDGDTLTCNDCDKDFTLSVNHSITFSTDKVDCEDEKHDMDFENRVISVSDQERCDKWNRERFLNKHWEPHKTVRIYCKNCEYTTHEEFELRQPCEKEQHVWDKPRGEAFNDYGTVDKIRIVDCKNCDEVNFVDNEGKIKI